MAAAVARAAAPTDDADVTGLDAHLAPYAQGMPRWVLFAVVGAGLLYLGVPWEQRLRTLRARALARGRIR